VSVYFNTYLLFNKAIQYRINDTCPISLYDVDDESFSDSDKSLIIEATPFGLKEARRITYYI